MRENLTATAHSISIALSFIQSCDKPKNLLDMRSALSALLVGSSLLASVFAFPPTHGPPPKAGHKIKPKVFIISMFPPEVRRLYAAV